MQKLYMIGDRESGILFVRTEPIKVVHIPLENIEEYAEEQGLTVDAVFADIGAASKEIVDRVASINSPPPDLYELIKTAFNGGSTITDAAFCFISDIQGDGFDTSRYAIMPIAEAASELAGYEARSELIVSNLGGGA